MLIELIRTKIIEYRKKQKMTQDEFAEICKVSRATYVNIEISKGVPSLEVVQNIINFLGIDISVFLGFNQDRDKNIKTSIDLLQMDLDRLKKLL